AYALVDSDEFGNTPGSFKKLIRMAAKKKAWKPKLENRTASEIETRITQALLYAVETNEALVRLGIDPMVDSTFAQIWANADFSKYDLPTKIESENPSDRIFAEAVLSRSAARDRMVTAWKTSIEN